MDTYKRARAFYGDEAAASLKPDVKPVDFLEQMQREMEDAELAKQLKPTATHRMGYDQEADAREKLRQDII